MKKIHQVSLVGSSSLSTLPAVPIPPCGTDQTQHRSAANNLAAPERPYRLQQPFAAINSVDANLNVKGLNCVPSPDASGNIYMSYQNEVDAFTPALVYKHDAAMHGNLGFSTLNLTDSCHSDFTGIGFISSDATGPFRELLGSTNSKITENISTLEMMNLDPMFNNMGGTNAMSGFGSIKGTTSSMPQEDPALFDTELDLNAIVSFTALSSDFNTTADFTGASTCYKTEFFNSNGTSNPVDDMIDFDFYLANLFLDY